MALLRLRAGVPEDLAWIRRLLASVPEAAGWAPGSDPFWVAEPEAGFVCWRAVDSNEFEVLNLAVAQEWRRQGVARALLEAAGVGGGTWFLEVRESNRAARALYESIGFQEAGRRKQYYQNPVEDGIVLRRKRCYS